MSIKFLDRRLGAVDLATEGEILNHRKLYSPHVARLKEVRMRCAGLGTNCHDGCARTTCNCLGLSRGAAGKAHPDSESAHCCAPQRRLDGTRCGALPCTHAGGAYKRRLAQTPPLQTRLATSCRRS